MKYKVTRFKSLEIALKEIEPYVRDGVHLLTGKPFKKLGGLRSREILGNWLICVVLNAYERVKSYTFTSDPQNGDGVIINNQNNKTWLTEHVMVSENRKSHLKDAPIESQIFQAYCAKIAKGGRAYALGKILVIFLHIGAGKWHPRKAAKKFPKDLIFSDVWVFALQSFENGEFTYGVAQLGGTERAAQTWTVKIDDQFAAWQVEMIQ